MLRVGLTGGIGAGKSTVAQRLVTRGALLVDADVIAREVVEPGTAGFAAVVAEFGPDVVAADGGLDRPALGRVVFADDDRRNALNAIIHPLVYARRTELVAAAPADALVVEDVPLLVENGLTAGYQLVVVVHAPAAERVRRLAATRGMAEDDAWGRVRAQADDEARRAAADVWIDNAGDVADTEAVVDALWTQRLVPFERHLRVGERAPRAPQAILVDPDPTWAAQGRRLAERARAAAGDRALRVDHIGSTSVPGLRAKDVIDLQIVVADLDTAMIVADEVRAAGLVPMPGRWWDGGRDGTEWDKAMACNADPGRAVNCHIRPSSSPTWRDALLLRDWLRVHRDGAMQYAALKARLAAAPHETIDDYAVAKTPWINASLDRAEAWASATGWSF